MPVLTAWVLHHRWDWRTSLTTLGLLLALGAGLAPSWATEPPPSATPRVLLLASFSPGRPGPDIYIQAFRQALRQHGLSGAQLRIEHLDLRPETQTRLTQLRAQLLREEFKHNPPQLVVAFQQPALEFWNQNLRDEFPEAALLSVVTRQPTAPPARQTPIFWQPIRINLVHNVEQALRLFPDTERLLLVVGAHPADQVYKQAFLAEIAPRYPWLTLEFTDNLSATEVVRKVSNLPSHTVLLLSSVSRDARGADTIGLELAEQVWQQANAPAFILFEEFVGQGVLGGEVVSLGREAARAAAVVAQGLQTGRWDTSPSQEIAHETRSVYDYRQLRRWGLDPATLPDTARVIHRPSTLWETYRTEVMVAGLVFASLCLLLGLLLVQNGRRTRAEAAARHSESLQRTLIESVPVALLIYDTTSHHFVAANPAASTLFGRSVEALLHSELPSLYAPEQPDGQPLARTIHHNIQHALSTGWVQTQRRIQRPDHSQRDCDLRLIRLPSEPTRLLVTLVDLTPLLIEQEALRRSDQRWRFALEGSGNGVWDLNLSTGENYMTDRFWQMLGYPDAKAGLHLTSWTDLLHPEDRPQALAALDQYLRGHSELYEAEFRLRCQNGHWIWVQSRGMIVARSAEGRPSRMVGTHADITTQKIDQQRIWTQAHIDELTGLANRRLLLIQTSDLLQRVDNIALLWVDLHHFKLINDTLGHAVGDEVLRHAARLMEAHAPPDGRVARIGADEFVLVFPCPSATLARQRASGLLQDLRTPVSTGGHLLNLEADVGIALAPQHGQEATQLLQRAGQALPRTGDSGSISVFDETLERQDRDRMEIASELVQGLHRGEFELFYQPIVHLASGRSHKAEALLRWHHPVRAPLGPSQFIPIAEATGTIHALGEWVFLQAVQQGSDWRRRLHPDFQLSINRSPVQFSGDTGGIQRGLSQLQAAGLPGQAIVLEITEGLLIDERESVRDALEQLRQSGVGASIDDFGTGYSSLAYVQDFDVDYIKIDKRFLHDLQPGSRNSMLCEAIIAMAHKLGIEVIAEGIETQDQLVQLKAMGCDHGQGYHLARPMAAQAFETWWLGQATV